MNSLIIKVIRNLKREMIKINRTIIKMIVRLIKSNYESRNKKQYAKLVYRRGDKIPIINE
jgi:hypothetical protein